MNNRSIIELIAKAKAGLLLDKEEIIKLLNIKKVEELALLFKSAQEVRSNHFGKKIFAYGFVYFSTYCRNDCAFCYYRKSNMIERYRKDPNEVIAIAQSLADSGVNLIDLTMGEDIAYHNEDFKTVLSIASQIKEKTNLPIMISPGVISNKIIDQLCDIGIEWFALYQETHNRELFAKLRLHQSYKERMQAKLYAKEKGMLIEEGILAGVGESVEDIADSILEMGRIGAMQVRVMSFVPQEGSPMKDIDSPDRLKELKIIAVMRLCYPNALIPASLDIDGIAGLEDRINAGANLITSIIPPKSGLMGVAQNRMDVDEGGRTIKEASHILEKLGLEIATAKEYKEAYLE
ncbi:MAG: methylornithine synthase PylB [Anaerovorax sp.]|nr:methylornithine synthase PylB [Anaerovorax sp.]